MENEKVQIGPFTIVSAAHLINDFYSNFLPQLLPLLIASLSISIGKATALVSAFTITSSLSQPIFGYLVDQKDQRWVVYVGTAWMAVLLSLTGVVDSYWQIFILSMFAGIGTAAFHPQASAMVSRFSGKNKGFIMSSFIAVGNAGVALAPLVLIPYFEKYGTDATIYMMIPGLLVSLFLIKFAPRDVKPKVQKSKMTAKIDLSLLFKGEMGKLMLIVAMRSLVFTGLMSLVRLYFDMQQVPPDVSATLLSVMLFTGALGGMTGGYLSDRFGRKVLITGSLALATPLFYGFLLTSGIISYVLLAVGAATLLSSFSVTVVAAQEIFPENKAMASGLSMGFAIGMGGLAVGILGVIADTIGLTATMYLMFAMPVLASLMGMRLKSDRKVSMVK